MSEYDTQSEPIPEARLAYETPPSLRPTLAVTLGTIGLRLIGIYYFVSAAAMLPQVVYYFVNIARNAAFTTQGYTTMFYAMTPLTYCGLGAFLLARGQRLAIRLFRTVPDSSSEASAISARQIATLLVAAVGLLSIILSLPELVGAAFALVTGQYRVISPYASSGRVTSGLFDASTIAFLLNALIQPAVGLYLLFRADRVTRTLPRNIVSG